MTDSSKITALYCRLSSDDAQGGDSFSIQNQKLILGRYAEENHLFNTRFFVDDGFSGVSFQRKGFQEMLAEIREGRVGTVITKDLSRLGRNYLETGKLIEEIFPSCGVRYIAVNDRVDTAQGENIFAPVRNWFNEYYVRDVSNKIRAVSQAKAARGERVNDEHPFGYFVDPKDRNHLLPDPETAGAVRRIFSMYADGKRICEIQQWLEDNKVPTPGALLFQRTGSKRHYRPGFSLYRWSDKTIMDMLVRVEYLGHTITAKTHKESYKCKRKIRNSPDQQHFFPNTHAPLVEQEVFDRVQQRLAAPKQRAVIDEPDVFSGLLYCADCGHKMYLRRGPATLERKHSYMCSSYLSHRRTGAECSTHYIRKSVLEEIVLGELRKVLSDAKAHQREFVRTAMEFGQRDTKKLLAAKQKEREKISVRIRDADMRYRRQYEDYALGRISAGKFETVSAGYEKSKAELQTKADVLQKEMDGISERKVNVDRFLAIAEKYSDIHELTYNLVHELIDRILIHERDAETGSVRINIYYSFIGQVERP